MFPINKTQHNWLIHKINNNIILNILHKIRGVVYDLGCGTRPYEQAILTCATNYYGVDWSNTQHAQRADIISDLNRPLNIKDGVADTVVSFQVLEHLSEPQNMINEAFRILKSEGNIVLTVPFQWWIHEAPYDYFRYTQFGLKYMFEKAGFVDIVVESQSGFFSMLILKMNYFSCRFVRGPKSLCLLIKLFLVPLWFFGQVLAPLLDMLDKNWDLETTGYVITARKPSTL